MVTLIQNKAQLYLKLTRIKPWGENGTFLKKIPSEMEVAPRYNC